MLQKKFYSQHGQDEYIFENFFKDRKNGFFVEIGAYDGVTFSNTLFFEETLGWNGICIEPIKTQYKSLVHKRRARCINACISNYEGEAEFHEVEMPGYGGMYSGLLENYDQRHYELIKHNASSSISYKVPVQKLSGILKELSIEVIDYCSIDTEGSEFQIMQDIKENGITINVLSLENNYRDINLHNLILSCGFLLNRTFAGFDDLYIRTAWVSEMLEKIKSK